MQRAVWKGKLNFQLGFCTLAFLHKHDNTMKKGIVPILHSINKIILPSFHKKDLNKLTKLDKLIIGYKLWIAKELAQNTKPMAGR